MDKTELTQGNSYLDVLVTIEKDMEESQKNKVIFALPETEGQFETLQQSIDFKRIVWRRLYSLGYAKHSTLKRRKLKSGSTLKISVKQQYQQAVKAFQKDARTKPDGWIGLETWECMQQLFAFEHDSNLSKWFESKFERILYKATHLRLITLGLVEKPGHQNRATGKVEAVDGGLDKWRYILNRLEPKAVNNDTHKHVLIEYLFDIDKLTKIVASNFGDLRMLSVQQNTKHNLSSDDILRFQKSLLKIELWLFGYEELKPGNLGTNYIASYQPEGTRTKNINPLAHALSEFLDDFKVSVNDNQATNESVLCELALKRLALLDDEQTRKQNTQEKSALLSDKINELSTEQRTQLTGDMRKTKLSDWLFDGLNRFFRWLKGSIASVFNFLSGVAKKAKKIINRLAVSAKKLASDAFSFVRRGMKILSDGITFLARKEFIAVDKSIVMHKSNDMDTIMFIPTNAKQKSVEMFNARIHRLLIRAKAAMALAVMLIDETLNILKMGSLSGPIAIVSLLIRIYKMRDSQAFILIRQAYDTFDNPI
jgi:hypothetical protein